MKQGLLMGLERMPDSHSLSSS